MATIEVMQVLIQQRIFQPASCSLFGLMRVTWSHGGLVALDFDAPFSCVPTQIMNSEMTQALAWLTAYFAAEPLPPLPEMQPKGTAFQQLVWSEVSRVPSGECITYAELAKRLGSAPRAVGGALRANPLPILIPCHRVVAASGLGGYAGASELGQARKKWLLSHETAL